MNAKTPKAKQKITDITPPQKGAGTPLPQIVIEKRAHLERAEGPGADVASTPPAPANTPTASTSTPTATTPKRTVITPPEDAEAKPAATETTEGAETKPTTTPSAPSMSAPTPAANQPAAKPTTTPIDSDDDTAVGGDTTDEAIDETKAEKEAVAAARRDQELEKFIDTKQFFVPINKQAQKRSIKVTLWLTALYIFLSLVLVNLMLDTGMILLLQKLPHTNFFSV